MRSSSSSGKSGNAALRGAAAPLNNYEFDFGLGSGASRGGASLNDQKNQNVKNSGSIPPAAAAAASSKPWVHKPIAGMMGSSMTKPMAMAGDITGKSWVSPSSTGSDSGIVGGVGAGKADMFGDLLSLGKSKPASNSSIGNIPSITSRSTVPMNAMKGPSLQEQQQQNKETNMWGDFLGSSSGNGVSKSSNAAASSFDPFEATFGKPAPVPKRDPLEDMLGGRKPPSRPSAGMNEPVKKSASDPLEDMLKKLSTRNKPAASASSGNNPSFGETSEPTITTTELQGLPPPPAGVSASMAMEKGSEFQKQGQFADAIKWLTWASGLATGPDSSSMLAGILTCRIVCFKEVGEYKKAVEDCCQVLDMGETDSTTEVLLQRAFLYESMEKYKLGVADLREVLKRDPLNRVARNTLSRLVKMID